MGNVGKHKEILKNLGVGESIQKEILDYCENKFNVIEYKPGPVEDEPFVTIWRSIINDIHGGNINEVMNSRLPHGDEDIKLKSPEKVSIEVYNSIAGNIPVIYAKDEEDFYEIIKKLIYKGRPAPNLEKTGAIPPGQSAEIMGNIYNSLIQELQKNIPQSGIGKLATNTGRAIASGTKAVGNAAVSGAKATGNAVASGTKAVGNAAVSGAKNLGNAAISGIKNLGKATGSALNATARGIGNFAGTMQNAYNNAVKNNSNTSEQEENVLRHKRKRKFYTKTFCEK